MGSLQDQIDFWHSLYEGSVVISYNQPAPYFGNEITKETAEVCHKSERVYEEIQTHEGNHTGAEGLWKFRGEPHIITGFCGLRLYLGELSPIWGTGSPTVMGVGLLVEKTSGKPWELHGVA